MAIYSPYQLRIRGTEENIVYRLPAGYTRIGRNPGNDVVLADPHVSQSHAELLCQQQGENWILRISDLGSTNGTKLNQEPLRPHLSVQIRNANSSVPVGAKIQIVSYTLTVEFFVEAPRETVSPPAPVDVTQDGYRLYPYPYAGEIPRGLSRYSQRLLSYLPDIYQPSPEALIRMAQWRDVPLTELDRSPETFLPRFLALFESVLLPIESVINHFDLYLDPKSAPHDLLPWLEHWFRLPFFANLTEAQRQEMRIGLSEEQRRNLLLQAHELFARKGTCAGLCQLLHLFCQRPAGPPITIRIDDETAIAYHFIVTITPKPPLSEEIIKALIEAYKPVHTTYKLEIVL